MDIKWVPKRKNIYGTEHFEIPIITLYNQGKSYSEISNELGCDYSTIKRFLKKNNIEIRPRYCRSANIYKDNLQNIDKLLNEGKSLNEISAILNLKYQNMLYHYRKQKKEIFYE